MESKIKFINIFFKKSIIESVLYDQIFIKITGHLLADLKYLIMSNILNLIDVQYAVKILGHRKTFLKGC